MYRRILIPLDGTDCSESALPHAEALAKRFGAELILLRVVEPINVAPVTPIEAGFWTPVPPNLPENAETGEEAARNYMETVAQRVRDAGIVATEVEWGGAVEQISRSAEEHQVDLIVMGTHGRHGLERLLLGSTSESLLHHTDVPLLLVKYQPDPPDTP